MNLIPDDAIATIVAVDVGESDHQVPSTMAVYSYEPDANDPELWHLTEIEREGDGSLRVDAEGRKISIYGTSPDNMHNANNIASMLGWKTCQLFGKDVDLERECLRQLVNVQVLNAPPAEAPLAPAGAPSAAARAPVESIPQPRPTPRRQESNFIDVPDNIANSPLPSDPHELMPPGGDDDGAVGLASVTQAIEERAAAEIKVAALEERLQSQLALTKQVQTRCDQLETENQRLRAHGQQAPSSDGVSPLFSALLHFAECHLGQCLADGSTAAEPLVAALKAHGFGLKISIVPTAA